MTDSFVRFSCTKDWLSDNKPAAEKAWNEGADSDSEGKGLQFDNHVLCTECYIDDGVLTLGLSDSAKGTPLIYIEIPLSAETLTHFASAIRQQYDTLAKAVKKLEGSA